MINVLGTFSAIWLVLWVLLSVLFVLIYPVVRPLLFRLHPRYGSALLLFYWTVPFLASISSTLILFLPTVESVLVEAHCHTECLEHAPIIHSDGLAWFGVVIGSIVFVLLSAQFVLTMRRSVQLHRQFSSLGRSRGEYYAIKSQCPLVFTLGWWNPSIYVSDGLALGCDERDLSIILRHEQAHQERRDNLRLLLARLCSAILSQSLARQMMADLQLMTEEACDFRAAEKFGHIAVAETLVKVKRLLMAHPAPLPMGVLGFAEREVETRIMALLNAASRVSPKPWQLFLLGVGILLGLMLLVSPLHHGSEWVITFLAADGPHLH